MSDELFVLYDLHTVTDDEDDDSLYSTESPLCVPQDSLDEIEFFPNFVSDAISLSDDNFLNEMSLFEGPFHQSDNTEKQKARVMLRKRVALEDCSNDHFARKKQRSKREGKRGVWSMNDVSFAAENEKPTINDVCIAAENEKPTGRRRKCSHCETTHTPQWRIGPLGPNTLCNACGVRYRSGRLLPEYRPAASPTFDSHKHSNFHKKILRKKGVPVYERTSSK